MVGNENKHRVTNKGTCVASKCKLLTVDFEKSEARSFKTP